MDKVKNYSPELLNWFEEKFPGKKKLYYFFKHGVEVEFFEERYNGFILPYRFIKEVVDESLIYQEQISPFNEKYNFFKKVSDDSYVNNVVMFVSDIDEYNRFCKDINDTADGLYQIDDNDIDSYIQFLDAYQIYVFDGLFFDITEEIKNKLIEYYNIVKEYIPVNKEKYDSKTYEHYLKMLDYTKDSIEDTDVLTLFEINIL